MIAALPAGRVIALLSVIALTNRPTSLHAQRGDKDLGTVRGAVKTPDGVPISGAQLRIANAPATIESDDAGSFTIARFPVGQTWLQVRRIGYKPDSVLIVVESGKTAGANVVLQRVAVDLAAVRVLGRRDIIGPMAGFYSRQSKGSGHFFTHADLEKRNPPTMTSLLSSVPGIRIEARSLKSNVRVRGSKCQPSVRLDGVSLSGMELDLDSFDPLSFDGIEVYSGGSTVPIEFATNREVSGSCGTIVLWTKLGQLREPGRKKDAISAPAQIAKMLDELRVFTATDVDVLAQLDSTTIVRPIYPDGLFESQTPGSVLAEFVVGTNGAVLPETFSAVTTTHRDFVEPVRRALREQRFVPAQRKGQSVQQVVQQLFEFLPDSTARRKR